MKLLWFVCSGYKNIVQPVRLEPLQQFVVIHGANNVGKSNVLEAMGLFFLALAAFGEDAAGGGGLREAHSRVGGAEPAGGLRSAVRSTTFFHDRQYPLQEIFNLAVASPISLHAGIEMSPEDTLAVRLELTRRQDEVDIRLLELGDVDPVVAPPVDAEARRLASFDRLVAGARSLPEEAGPFLLVRADRTVVGTSTPGEADPAGQRKSLPGGLANVIWEAQEAPPGSKLRGRFERFVSLLDRFSDLTGKGRWRATYDRRRDRADLAFDTPNQRTPLHLLGSGIQQVVQLLARLVLFAPDVAAVEEPELNLKFDTQERLRDVLRELVAGAEAPAQLVLTSHASAFELTKDLFLLRATANGPAVERLPAAEARRVVLPREEVPREAGAPLGYVTSEGLLKLPTEVRVGLGVSRGGGVTFLPLKHGTYEILSDDQFIERLGERESAE